jgi:hypothetical protein
MNRNLFRNYLFILVLVSLSLASCKGDNGGGAQPEVFQLLRVSAGGTTLGSSSTASGIVVDAGVLIEFSAPADTSTVSESVRLVQAENPATPVPVRFEFSAGGRHILVIPAADLQWRTTYRVEIGASLRSQNGAVFPGVSYLFETQNGSVNLQTATINGRSMRVPAVIRDITFENVQIQLSFSETVTEADLRSHTRLSPAAALNFALSEDRLTANISISEPLDYYTNYVFTLSSTMKSENGYDFAGFSKGFQTGLDSGLKFPELDDEALMDLVQSTTFRYFWDFAHPVSGMTRERLSSGELVTIGGSGFGLMAVITGIERGYITRSEGIERFQQVTAFLSHADRFRGVWPHWLNGSTGRTIPFSNNDNGGDLVETALMAQGLVTVREYLNASHTVESGIIDRINDLLNSIEWDWYTRGGQNVLYWHWSPDRGWAMNMHVSGYNEALITYIMAASSKNHGISPQVYHTGWARGGAIRNGKTFYGLQLPLGYDYGGPLFFAHYSFLGLDPRGLSDQYADYWLQNRNHTLINRAHSIANPLNHVGYSADSWGLTASDDHTGYGVHEPTRDNGTITPSAALSSIPYTPEESLQAMRHFYHILGDKLWGEYGFFDAFNPTQAWWSQQYLAIDQGPILVMIENHRSALLWNLFMRAPEIQKALEILDFNSTTR